MTTVEVHGTQRRNTRESRKIFVKTKEPEKGAQEREIQWKFSFSYHEAVENKQKDKMRSTRIKTHVWIRKERKTLTDPAGYKYGKSSQHLKPIDGILSEYQKLLLQSTKAKQPSTKFTKCNKFTKIWIFWIFCFRSLHWGNENIWISCCRRIASLAKGDQFHATRKQHASVNWHSQQAEVWFRKRISIWEFSMKNEQFL